MASCQVREGCVVTALPCGPHGAVTFCTLYGPAASSWDSAGWAPGTVVLAVDFIYAGTPGFNRDTWRILCAIPK